MVGDGGLLWFYLNGLKRDGNSVAGLLPALTASIFAHLPIFAWRACEHQYGERLWVGFAPAASS
eukprot:4340329-Amphidinium_carterae.1